LREKEAAEHPAEDLGRITANITSAHDETRSERKHVAALKAKNRKHLFQECRKRLKT